ncbi:AAA family ATPase [Lentibacillus amyloliquefaciens]|uniref:DNA-binding protein n=1 Tax=Lentibacillus amyloliquefaciens TaxID=1472767 RepID=A0A0U4F4K6_9BACI|nr:AAA family ATPase [Lentibacillus amyloliquefaciens]ALX50439.1 DNA-binding protein [Lentibacillus amyloliquefaciens]
MNITSAADISESRATYLLYAPPGTGKTHTINFLEGKTLYIAIDKTQYPLKGNKNIDILDFDTHNAWSAWTDLIKWLADNDLSKYDNLVFDNVSELFRSMLGNLGREGKNNRVPEMQHYQQIDFFIIDSLRFINSLNKKVIYLAWETTDEFQTEGGQIFNRTFPDIRSKIINNFMGLCQVVSKLAINNRTENRGFILQPSNSIFAKNQLDQRKHCLQEDIFKVGEETASDAE